MRSSVERSTQCPMDRPSFLFFVRAVLPERARRRPVWAAPEGGGQILIKTSCSARLHCAEWSCVVLSDSPRHHNGSGRDWTYKSAIGTKGFAGLFGWRTFSEWCVIQPQISHTRLIPTIPCYRLGQDAGDLVRGSDGGGPSPRLLERLAVVSGNKNFLMLDFREASF